MRERTYKWILEYSCDSGWVTVRKDYVRSLQISFTGTPDQIKEQFKECKRLKKRELEGITEAMKKWEKEFIN